LNLKAIHQQFCRGTGTGRAQLSCVLGENYVIIRLSAHMLLPGCAGSNPLNSYPLIAIFSILVLFILLGHTRCHFN